MSDPITLRAEKIIDAYAEGIDGLSNDDCKELAEDKIVTSQQCAVLQEALRGGAGGIITNEEVEKLHASLSGLPFDSIYAISGTDGKKALKARAKALSDTASSFFEWEYKQFAAIQELRLMGEDGIDGLCEAADGRWLGFAAYARVLDALNEIPEASYPLSTLDVFIRGASLQYSNIQFKAVTGLAKHQNWQRPWVNDGREFSRKDQVISALVNAVGNGDEELQKIAGAALLAAGELAIPALIAAAKLPEIDSALIDTFSDYCLMRAAKQSVMSVLVKRGPLAASAVVNALDDSDSNVRLLAAETLGRMGATAAFTVPKLTELLHDPELDVRVSALTALWLIDRETAKGVMGASTFENLNSVGILKL
ncbi:MAG: HEAT repeat domain-containing protein [Deltaproteobacteria bacterium]|nr:HEAT repeat domain-containing protein [Deltaproteobacteria bacterium]